MNIDGIDIPLAVEHAGPKAIEAYVAAIKAQASTDEALVAAGITTTTKPDTTTDAADAAPAPATKAKKG